MAVQVDPGKLRTKISVFDKPGEDAWDKEGYPAQEPVNVFGEGKSRRCHWVNAHGSEVYESRQAGVIEPATLTMRYTPKITPTCTLYKGSDPEPYEIISVNDVEDRHAWLEVKVQRKVASKQ